jgi:hypothetical protein
MPKKTKKTIDQTDRIANRQRNKTIMEAREKRMRMHHERRIAEDLNRVISKWHDARLPKDIVVGFSAFYMVNFVFDCYTPTDANHLLVSAISRELLKTDAIEDSETMIQ